MQILSVQTCHSLNLSWMNFILVRSQEFMEDHFLHSVFIWGLWPGHHLNSYLHLSRLWKNHPSSLWRIKLKQRKCAMDYDIWPEQNKVMYLHGSRGNDSWESKSRYNYTRSQRRQQPCLLKVTSAGFCAGICRTILMDCRKKSIFCYYRNSDFCVSFPLYSEPFAVYSVYSSNAE
jgi:hypothetical protein